MIILTKRVNESFKTDIILELCLKDKEFDHILNSFKLS